MKPPLSASKVQGRKKSLLERFRDTTFGGLLFVTLWLAGGLLTAEHSGWLDGLDNLMFAHAVDSSRAASTEAIRPADTLIVTISRSFYETEFRERSPLDPRLVNRIVNVIADSQPSKLAIDLDLSPSPSDADLVGAQAARELILARLGVLAGAGARVLLVLPGASSTPAEQERKTSWASGVCKAGVELADPNLGLTQTPAGLSLLKYVPTLPSLGILMASNTRPGLCASRNDNGKLPSLMLAPNYAAVSVMNQTAAGDRLRLNFKGFDEARLFSLKGLSDLDRLASALATNKVKNVMLAGAYSLDDTFALPNSRTVNGAEVHMAVAYSEKNPVRSGHLVAYLLDVGLGVVAGYFLSLLWHGYQKKNLFHVKAACLAGALLMIAGLSLLMVLAMPYLLENDYWINAVPLLIGLAVHGLIETLHTGHEHSGENSLNAYSSWQQKASNISQYAWTAMQCGLILAGFYWIGLSLLHH